jgi:tetratricopeptide (TPR) repeat protein
VYKARGRIHANLGEYPQAINSYTRALLLERDADTFSWRGWAHLQTQAPLPALADFEEALRDNPKHAWALCGRGQALVLQGQVDRAVADAEAALAQGGGGTDASADQETAKLLCNAAGIYARAAVQVDAASRRADRPTPVTVRRYEERARHLIDRAVRSLPADQQGRFWREQVLKDAALKTLAK